MKYEVLEKQDIEIRSWAFMINVLSWRYLLMNSEASFSTFSDQTKNCEIPSAAFLFISWLSRNKEKSNKVKYLIFCKKHFYVQRFGGDAASLLGRHK